MFNEVAHCRMNMRKDLIKENFAYIEGEYGRYHRIKLISDKIDQNKKLKLITYYTSVKDIVFCF